MEMIGHDDVAIKFNTAEAVRHSSPHVVHQLAGIIQMHAMIRDLTESIGTIVN